MKKVFAVFLVAAVFVFGFVGALAVIPHVHGHDVDHSSHGICPIHQYNLHGVHAAPDGEIKWILEYEWRF